MKTFDNPPRHIETVTVNRSIVSKDGTFLTLTWSNGWSFGGCPVEHAPALPVGATVDVETVNFSTVTGIRTGRRWLYRKSDQDLEAEHRALVARIADDHHAQLERNRDDWQQRQEALPDALRTRLEHFHGRGGDHFRVNGWGYELTVCELAALYLAAATENGVPDTTPEIDAYASKHGTSGNQHSCARGIALRLGLGVTIDVVPAALAPLTGDPDYSKGNTA